MTRKLSAFLAYFDGNPVVTGKFPSQKGVHQGFSGREYTNQGRTWSSRARGSAENPDDVIKWKHLPRYWPFVRGIHRPPVNSPHKGQWRGALMFSLICVWINGWENNGEAGDLVYRVCFKILLTAPCVTPAIRVISICRRLSRESLTMSFNISPETWRGSIWILQNPDQEVVSSDGIRVNLTLLAPSTDLPPWFQTNLLIQSCMKFLTEIHSDRFQIMRFEINYSH